MYYLNFRTDNNIPLNQLSLLTVKLTFIENTQVFPVRQTFIYIKFVLLLTNVLRRKMRRF